MNRPDESIVAPPADAQIIRFWVERLHAIGATTTERTQAASELSRLHIRTRGAVTARGSVSRAAENDPAMLQGDLEAVLAALDDESVAVRREVAFALGEWGGAKAASLLAQMIMRGGQYPGAQPGTEQQEVRRAAISALGKIGGKEAVAALCYVAQRELESDEAIRYDALSALALLALQETGAGTQTARGSMRVRGGMVKPRPGINADAEQVIETLRAIRDDDGEQEHIRCQAEAALEPWLA